MLASLTDERFSREGWLFEPKFDGERCLAFKQGKEVKLFSRNRKAINGNYPELAEALERQEHDLIVDGEVVAFEGAITSFAKLQGLGLSGSTETPPVSLQGPAPSGGTGRSPYSHSGAGAYSEP